MPKKIYRATGLILAFMLLASCARHQQPGRLGLSADGHRVVDYLFADWEQSFHSTTIPEAMAELAIKSDDAFRLEVIDYLRANLGLATNLRSWGPNNYLFTNDEKLIAKVLLNTFRDENRLPTPQEVSAATAIDAQEINSRLAFMGKAGFLETSADENYQLTDGSELWGGPLRHNFHTVHVEGEPVFDVW